MHVGIVEAGDDGSAPEVKHLRRRPTLPQNRLIGAGGANLAVLDGDGFDERRHTIRGNPGVMQDEVGRHTSLLYSGFI